MVQGHPVSVKTATGRTVAYKEVYNGLGLEPVYGDKDPEFVRNMENRKVYLQRKDGTFVLTRIRRVKLMNEKGVDEELTAERDPREEDVEEIEKIGEEYRIITKKEVEEILEIMETASEYKATPPPRESEEGGEREEARGGDGMEVEWINMSRSDRIEIVVEAVREYRKEEIEKLGKEMEIDSEDEGEAKDVLMADEGDAMVEAGKEIVRGDTKRKWEEEDEEDVWNVWINPRKIK